MADKNELGILCKEDGKFYYLEYGNLSLPPETIPTILNTLTARGLINFTAMQNDRPVQQYRTMKYADAVKDNLTIEPIFLTPIAKQLYDAHKTVTTEKPLWGETE